MRIFSIDSDRLFVEILSNSDLINYNDPYMYIYVEFFCRSKLSVFFLKRDALSDLS